VSVPVKLTTAELRVLLWVEYHNVERPSLSELEAAVRQGLASWRGREALTIHLTEAGRAVLAASKK
jgi:hypothetical protein